MSSNPDDWREEARSLLKQSMIEKKISENCEIRSKELHTKSRTHKDMSDRLYNTSMDMYAEHGELNDDD